MVRQLALAVLLLVSAASGPTVAAEGPRHVAVRYSAPDACPDDAQLVASVERFLGQPLREAREQELAASVMVQGSSGAFAAKLTFTSGRGTEERFVEDADCAKLADAAALLVALAIDPERVHAQQAAADAPATEPEVPPTARVVEAAPSPPAPSQPCPTHTSAKAVPERHVVAQLGGFVGVGVMPNVAAGLGVDFGARFGRWQVELVGNYWLGGSADAVGPASIDLSLATAGLRACRVLPDTSWSFLGCVQSDLGDMAGSGQEVDAAHTQHAVFADVGALAMAHYSRLEPAPWAGLGVFWVVARPPFGLSSQGTPSEAFRPARVAMLGYLGVAVGP
ncbi:MAG TPA: hypothetical protein VJN18_02025 [Polyangiaceae bacterium]|nr:hypothetical protein [Polyangiaceae bacterium]